MEKTKKQGGTSGAFFRVDSETYNDFIRKTKDSNIKGVQGQSQKEIIAEKLLELYTKNGDALWEFLFETKKEVKNGN
jgi:hypothetical protein